MTLTEARPTVPGETTSRLAFSDSAVKLIEELWGRYGPLMYHQSGGCCDGSSPMCFPLGDFVIGARDVQLGELALPQRDGEGRTVPFYMSGEQFDLWKHTHLTVDVVPGRGSGFSLEAPEGVRFLIRSRLMQQKG